MKMADKPETCVVVRGTIIGLVVLSVLYPVMLVFGMNNWTTVILYYAVPVTGAVTAFLIYHDFSKTKISAGENKEISTEQKAEPLKQKSEYDGKWVEVYTTGNQVFRGKVFSYADGILGLESVSRIDSSAESGRLDRMFLDRNAISRIEVASVQKDDFPNEEDIL